MWKELPTRNSVFETDGAIGAGKSTAIKLLSQYVPINNLEELIRPHFHETKVNGVLIPKDDVMLTWLYHNLVKYAILFNIYSSLKRVNLLNNAFSLPGLTGSDRCIFGDHIFMKKYLNDGIVTKKHYAYVMSFFRENIKSLNNKYSDFIIYMACGSKELADRAEKRGRESEKKGPRIISPDKKFALWSMRDEVLSMAQKHAPQLYGALKYLSNEPIPDVLESIGLSEEYLDSLNKQYGGVEATGLIDVLTEHNYGKKKVLGIVNSESLERTDNTLHTLMYLDYLGITLMIQKMLEGFGFEYRAEASDKVITYVAPERLRKTYVEVPSHHRFKD